MHKIARKAVALAFSVGLVATLGAGVAQAADNHGCAPGYACIYSGATWNGGNPEHRYYTYGAHRLYDEYGTHRVFNNQMNGATMWLCRDSAGKDCPNYVPAGRYYDVNLTPFNSIKLTR